jgi:hypothetical protein
MFADPAIFLFVSKEISFLSRFVESDSKEELNLIAFLMFCRIEERDTFKRVLTTHFLQSKTVSLISELTLQQKIATKIVDLIDSEFQPSEKERENVRAICQDLDGLTKEKSDLTDKKKLEIKEKILGLMPPLVQAIKDTVQIHLQEGLTDGSREKIIKEVARVCFTSQSPTMEEVNRCLLLFEGCEKITTVLQEIYQLRNDYEVKKPATGCYTGATTALLRSLSRIGSL